MSAPDTGNPPALVVQDLHAWYGESHVLHGVDMTVSPGECVALLGRNGAGRTTTLRAIFGRCSRQWPGHRKQAYVRDRALRCRLLPRAPRNILQSIVRREPAAAADAC